MELAMSVEFVYKYVCVYDKILCSCHTCTFKGYYMEFQQLQNIKFFATLLAHVIVIVSN